MKIAQRVGWLVTGILIGVLGMSLLGTVHAQQSKGQSRWKALPEEYPEGTNAVSVQYLKDIKSNTCWLVVGKNNGGGIAPAPLNACQ